MLIMEHHPGDILWTDHQQVIWLFDIDGVIWGKGKNNWKIVKPLLNKAKELTL